MAKKVYFLLFLSLLATMACFGHIVLAGVAIGSRSDEVKTIQEILKEDPDIYPEGYVTGYYGSLTEKAIKKPTKHTQHTETGELDDITEKCIYPIEYKVTVVSPNGGEVLDRNTIQTIKWEVTTPPGIAEVPPFWPEASIDLFRKEYYKCGESSDQKCPGVVKSVFVRHIATVNLFDKSYSWKVSSDIANSKDYVVRISIGKNIASLWRWEKSQGPQPLAPEIWPSSVPSTLINWDESDNVFEIMGTITPSCPTCPTCPNQNDVIISLTQIIEQLQKIITLLKSK